MASKKISMAVIKRLPRYHRYLNYLLELGIKRVSSKELSSRMGITASQIRQDLNCFGGFGQQGYGYNVESLYSEIGNILGINKTFYCIIIGAGNMGQALSNYENFVKRGFKIIGIFDVNPAVIGKKLKNLEVMNLDLLEDFISQNKVDIAMLCVPYRETASVADRVAKLGVKGLWNFSPMDLKIPYDVIVENVHLSDSLMVLGYKLNDKFERE
ncbi:MAG TPA: redox-sensing transcriptional repressor Rex [Ruminiclostridium sp.]|nr:redox-sensing transcriptional repressor Rex [Ruminiclostridium sp.]